jgi:hypothetical protein
MKIASEIPWQGRRFELPIERIKGCERFGFDAVFTAEGIGSDALTPLGDLAAVTNRNTCALACKIRCAARARRSASRTRGRVRSGCGPG